MVKYITGMKFSSLFLLACGAVVREREALAGLEAVTNRYGQPDLAFVMLIDCIACNWWMPLPLELSA